MAGGGGHLLRRAVAARRAAPRDLQRIAQPSPAHVNDGAEHDGTRPRACTTCGRGIAAAWSTIGSFDGIHRGHQAHARERCGDRARELGLPATVLTFEPMPREYFRRRRGAGAAHALAREAARRSRATASIACVCLRFDEELRAIERASSSIERLLHRRARRAARGGRARLSRSGAAARAAIDAAARRGDAARLRARAGAAGRASTACASAVRGCARRSPPAISTRARDLLGRPYRMTRPRASRASSSAASWVSRRRTCALQRKVVPLPGHLRGARRGRGLARSRPARREPRHAADGGRHRAAARSACVRFRRRPVRPRAGSRVRREAARRGEVRRRSTRWWSRCTATRRRRARSC